MSSMGRSPCLPALALLLALVRPSLAAPAPPCDDPQAILLFQQGNQAFREQRWLDAEAAYRLSWARQRAYDVAGNLGEVELRLGKHREAAFFLHFSVTHAPPGTPLDRLSRSRRYLAQAQRSVARISARPSQPGVRVLLDGRPLDDDELEGPVFVEPGPHMLEAQRRGFSSSHHLIEAAPGSVHDVRLDLAPLLPSLPRSDTGPRPGWIVGGSMLAASGLATGIVFTVAASASSRTAERDRQRVGHILCLGAADPRCAMANRAQQARERSTQLAVTGYALAGGALVVTLAYALWPRGGFPEHMAILPTLGPRGVPGGILFRGRF